MCVKCQKYLLLFRGLKIKRRTQIRTTLKKKAFEDAGIPLRQVTLNMLNALETEIDVDGLGGDVKLEFEAPSEEVPTV
ncbi:uncharacterized protein LOC113506658 isoform X4 [Trichoplusia ni]|uniref:Uncharacterized protein LOC113506658 isoform X4 n=1 Tax=Trichoplusia ni TaxID=7111 RepID=A0A7E5WWQ8_TRINI|nr:uncharacterized protein LOC113506658 isoform X4 [Trichoplusia ni]